MIIFTSLETPHNSLQNESKIIKIRLLSSLMHTAKVLFKFLKFLSLWLFAANKARKISEKPALKKLNDHFKYINLISSFVSIQVNCS